jgi:hypothetical protein
MSNRKRCHWSWIVATVIAAPVIYAASFGPSCWISNRSGMGERALSVAYQPMLWLWMRTDQPAKVVQWYALLGTHDDSHAINSVDGTFEISW